MDFSGTVRSFGVVFVVFFLFGGFTGVLIIGLGGSERVIDVPEVGGVSGVVIFSVVGVEGIGGKFISTVGGTKRISGVTKVEGTKSISGVDDEEMLEIFGIVDVEIVSGVEGVFITRVGGTKRISGV